MRNNSLSVKPTVATLPRLGDKKATVSRDLDKFNFRFSQTTGEYLMGWQSSPSALVRAMPIILLSIIALIVFAVLSREMVIFSLIVITVIVLVTLYIVIQKPDRAVVVDTYTGKVGDKSSKDIIEGEEVDYQPQGNISQVIKNEKIPKQLKKV